ncbi:YadA-like family protein [Paraburkholderia sp. DHOC27]|uniref:YadA-like family protein n=1 Tax=Paraburkholderia sp. DHOC27 TaxID=2303330 RepID=UPI000E3E3DF3|nr:YadA-like family protein [Paraburkholderia sp. DHOC27]RFU45811.1 hypothetical protein D0B32_19220 [Paraburkholderia sp. DHOC27]
MNKSYKTVWNETTGTYVAASETAKSRGKAGKSQKALAAALMALGIGASVDAKATTAGNGYQAGGCTVTDTTPTDPSNSIAIDGASSKYCASATGNSSIAIGAATTAGGVGTGSSLGGLTDTTIAAGNPTGYNQVALGVGASASATAALAIGDRSLTSGISAVAIGHNATASGNSSLAMAETSSATGVGSVALGALATASSAGAVALGSNSVANRANTVSVGSSSQQRQLVNVAAGQQKTDAVNLGQLQAAGLTTDSSGNATNSFVAYDDSTLGKVTLKGASGTTLTDLAAGAVSSSSTDAINGSQLYANAASAASALGGGSSVTASGTISAPSYVVGGTTVSNVGAALTNLDGRVTTNASSISNLQTTVTNISNGTGVANSAYVKVNGGAGDGSDSASTTSGGGIAIGVNAHADTGNYTGSIAIGSGATAASNGFYGPTALGSGAYATGSSTAVGYTATANGSYSVAVGRGASGNANSSVAVGGSSTASGGGAVALGQAASASAGIALGQSSVSSASNTVSVGNSTLQRQIVNVAAGQQSTDAVNYGQLKSAGLKVDSSGNATNSFVAYNDTTLGKVTLGGASGTTLTNVAAGTLSASSTDAVNGSQLYTTNQSVTQNTSDIATLNTQVGAINGEMTDAVKYDSSAHDTITLAGTSGTKLTNLTAGSLSASSTDAVNGSQLYATNSNVTNLQSTVNNISNGVGIKYVHVQAISGTNTDSVTTAPGDVAIGGRATAVGGSGAAATAVGTDAAATAIQTVALGTSATASANGDTALGANAQAVGSGSGGSATAVGYNAIANGKLAIAFGYRASASATNAVALGANSVADVANTVSVGSSSLQRKVVNMAAGAVSASSTDAVNGSQLYATNQNVTQNAGNITNLDSRVTNVEGSVTSLTNQINSGGLGLVQQDTTTGAVAVAGSTGGTSVDFTGTAGARELLGVAAGTTDTSAVNLGQLKSLGLSTDASGNVTNAFVAYDDASKAKATFGGASGTTLSNVAAGAVSASSMDAVNGSQLYTTNQNVAQNTSDIAQNTSDIAQNTSDIAQNTSNITNLDSRVTNVEGSVTSLTDQINSGAVGLVQQDATTGAVTVASSTGGTSVDFTGTAGARELLGVAAGTTDTSAVNLGQLKSLGLNTDASGNVTNAFVAYDDASKAKATFGGASGTTLSNVAAGAVSASSMDAVNGSQLYTTNQNVAQNTSDIAQNTSNIAQNTTNITNLDSRVTNVEGSVSSLTDQINSGTVGLVQQDATTGAVTVASSTGGTSVDFTGTAGARELLGVAAGTTNSSAVNLGQLNPVVASLGGGAQVNADGSVTGPTYHMQGGTQTTVGGALDTLDTNLSSLETQINNGSIGIVTQDSTSRDINVGSTTDGLRVNVAGTAGNRVVTGVAAGAVGASSVEAINGSQLYANASSTAAALGGGSTVNSDGTVSAPSYNVGGTVVNNVGAAVSNLDGRVTQNTSDIASLQSTVGTMSGSVANAVSYDSSAHNQVTLGGSTDAPAVKLTNLQQGEISETSTDAVTGSQLWDTNQQLSNLTQAVQNEQQSGSATISSNTGNQPAASASGNNAIAIGGGAQASGDNSVALGAGSVADQANTVSVGSQGNERRITNVADGQAPTDAVNMRQFQAGVNDVARSAYSGVAAATALSMIPEVDAGKTLAIGVGGGTYKGYQAAAVGASARITQNLKVKIGAGVSGSETTVGAGASYQW